MDSWWRYQRFDAYIDKLQVLLLPLQKTAWLMIQKEWKSIKD